MFSVMQDFLLSSFVSFLLFRVFLKNKLFLPKDKPNARSSHVKPTPTSGGLVLLIIGILFSFKTNFWIPLISSPLAIVGLIDDYLKLSPMVRYFFQLLTAVAIIFSTNLIYITDSFDSVLIRILSLFFLILIATAIINFINFMDGIDGLVAGSMSIILTFAIITGSTYLIPIFASLIIFLYFNWQPSKIFMGDVGSYFLGSIFVSEVFSKTNIYSSLILISLCLPLILDSIVCIFRRLCHKQNIFSAHNLHLYQRLYQAGMKHSSIAIIYIGFVLLMGLCSMFDNLYLIIFSIMFTIATGYYLDKYVAVSFSNSLIKGLK